MLVSMPRSSQAGYSVCALSRPHSDEGSGHAEEVLQKNFDRGVSDRRAGARGWE
jgi:hypothetical protein